LAEILIPTEIVLQAVVVWGCRRKAGIHKRSVAICSGSETKS
jgi:hypothetical protein